MPVILHRDPPDIDRRLRELGLDREGLIEAVRASVAFRAGCTDNDPANAPGWEGYRGAVRRLREIYRSVGWDKERRDNVEVIRHPGLKLRIAYLATDARTCDPIVQPSNRYPKGPAQQRAASANGQMDLFPDTLEDEDGNPHDGHSTWLLCVYDDGHGTVLAELSRPTGFDGNHVSAFSERIFLIGPGEWDGLALAGDDGDDDSDIEVPVRRKG